MSISGVNLNCPESVTVTSSQISSEESLKKYGIPIHKQNKPFDINRHDWDRVYFDEKEILNNKWILSKFDEKERTKRQEQYIKKYLPEINRGGKYILDVAAGPGEFMDIAKKRGCKTIGVEMIEPIENIENEELRIKYITTKHVEKGLDIIYSDFNRILSDGHKAVNNVLFDIINCQSAINKINCASFDYKRGENGVYDNNGEWIINERFDAFFNVFFQWCKKHLVPGGVLMLAALNATNKKQYSERIQKIAIDNKFKVEINDRDLEHRFRKAA
jgi:2-polyprenyl-3-methyl-5-hydroxy-6-metoxy-1,4-benzoquinol methylase